MVSQGAGRPAVQIGPGPFVGRLIANFNVNLGKPDCWLDRPFILDSTTTRGGKWIWWRCLEHEFAARSRLPHRNQPPHRRTLWMASPVSRTIF
jgi:hypothetical protein